MSVHAKAPASPSTPTRNIEPKPQAHGAETTDFAHLARAAHPRAHIGDEPPEQTALLPAKPPVGEHGGEAAPSQANGSLLVERDPASGQLAKREFLARLRARVEAAAELELVGTGWTTAECPWFDYWFGYYERRSARELEAAIVRWTSARNADTAEEYVAHVIDRVRSSVKHWRQTGIVDAPNEIQPVAASNIATSLGTGESLDSSTKTRMEAALAMPLGGVLVHTNRAAQSFVASSGARAIAVGRHIAFANNEYRPGTEVGDAMLAHELAHTRQQRNASDGAAVVGSTKHLEHEADQHAVGALGRLWGGLKNIARPRISSASLGLQRCQSKQSQQPSLAELSSTQAKAAWINKVMQQGGTYSPTANPKPFDPNTLDAKREVVRVFQLTKGPKEFAELEKALDMKSVLEFEGDFGSVMIGAAGPVLSQKPLLFEKQVSFIIDQSEYYAPTTETFVHYMFARMANDEIRAILAVLAEKGKLGKTVGQMPTVLALIEKRHIDIAKIDDKVGGGLKRFGRGVGNALSNLAKSDFSRDTDATSKFMTQNDWAQLMPPSYKAWRDKVVDASFKAAEDRMSDPLTLAFGAVDNLAFGIPGLVKSTATGVYHLGTGDYERAGEELTGAMIFVATYASAKVYGAVKGRATPETAPPANTIALESNLHAAEAISLTPEGTALVKRLNTKLGEAAVERVAGYLQESSEAQRLVLEHGEPAIYALDEAGGDVAKAQKALAALEAQVAADEAAARKVDAEKAAAEKAAADKAAAEKALAEKAAADKAAAERAAAERDAAKKAAADNAAAERAAEKKAAAEKAAADRAAARKAVAEKAAAERAAAKKAAAEKAAAEKAAAKKAVTDRAAAEKAAKKAATEKAKADRTAAKQEAADKAAAERAAKKAASDKAKADKAASRQKINEPPDERMDDDATTEPSTEELPADEQPAPTTNPDAQAPWQEGDNPRRYENYKYNLARRNAKRPADKQNRTLSEKDWWEAYGKKAPNNPYGGDGAPDHIAKAEELVDKARRDYPDQTRYVIRSNRKVPGLKQKPDAAVIDIRTNKVVKIYEAARFDEAGELIRPDERAKIVDYQTAGVPYEFHPVGPNAPPGGVLTWEPPPKKP